MDCHFLLQRTFPTQGSNPGLLHCRQTLYHLSHKGSPLVSPYFKYMNEERALYETIDVIGFLFLSCATDAFGSWMKPIATFSE